MPEITPDLLVLGAVWYVVFLLAITCHEGAHAWAAKLGGDMTAFEEGQVSLSPLPHIQREPFGTILVPLVSYFFVGWMVGWASAPYDPVWAQRYPRRVAWMAAAGPAANLVLVVIAAGAIRLGMWLEFFHPPQTVDFTRVVAANQEGLPELLATFLSILFVLNLLLFLFNLLPVPPLDGSSVITLLMNERTADRFREFTASYGLIGLMLAWYLFGKFFWPAFRIALSLLYPEAAYG